MTFFVKRETPILFLTNCERTNLFSLKRDLDPLSPFTTLLSVKWSLREVERKKYILLVLKVVAVAYERWSLTRGSNYSDFTWKRLVF